MIEAACWAHARRKLFDIHAATDSPTALEALERIGALYKIEAEIRGQSAEQRRAIRQTRALALLNDLHTWLHATEQALEEVGARRRDRLLIVSVELADALLRRWSR